MKKVPLSLVKDDLSKYLRLAESEEIVITHHGKPAGVLVGFETEDDWFDYRLENDPAFLNRTESNGLERASAREKGCGSRMSKSRRYRILLISFNCSGLAGCSRRLSDHT